MARLKKGVWLHMANLAANGPEQTREVVRKYADAGFDLLVPCVKDEDGLLDYHSNFGTTRPAFKKWDPLEVFADEARKARIKVHPWYCNAKEGQKSALLKKYPDAIAITRNGEKAEINGTYFVCIARPEIREYEAAIMKEVVDRYDVAGVHFDYIRLGEKACYCAHCRKVLKTLTGLKPDAIRNWGRMPEKWYQWRCDRVSKLVQEVSDYAHKRGKEASAAVFSGIPDAIVSQGQDFVHWSRQGWLDVVMPMNYYSIPWVMERHMIDHIAEHTGGKAEMWEGLARLYIDTPAQLAEQVKMVRDYGVKGVIIFAHTNLTKADFRNLAKF